MAAAIVNKWSKIGHGREGGSEIKRKIDLWSSSSLSLLSYLWLFWSWGFPLFSLILHPFSCSIWIAVCGAYVKGAHTGKSINQSLNQSTAGQRAATQMSPSRQWQDSMFPHVCASVMGKRNIESDNHFGLGAYSCSRLVHPTLLQLLTIVPCVLLQGVHAWTNTLSFSFQCWIDS